MVNQNPFPVDPMAAFYAAVTAVENGEVGEIELEYRFTTPTDYEVIMTVFVRREVRHLVSNPHLD